MRKQDDVPDRRHVGQDHGDPVDADPDPPCRRHPVLQRRRVTPRPTGVPLRPLPPQMLLVLGSRLRRCSIGVRELTVRRSDLHPPDHAVELFGQRRPIRCGRASGETSRGKSVTNPPGSTAPAPPASRTAPARSSRGPRRARPGDRGPSGPPPRALLPLQRSPVPPGPRTAGRGSRCSSGHWLLQVGFPGPDTRTRSQPRTARAHARIRASVRSISLVVAVRLVRSSIVNSGLCLWPMPSLRKSRPISYTFSMPPTSSRFRCSSRAMRRNRSRSSRCGAF